MNALSSGITSCVRILFLSGILVPNAIAQVAGAQPANLCGVEGQVLDAVTGAPVRRALITLVHKTAKPEFLTVRSDAAGKFVFQDLQPGDYALSGGARGYLLLADYNTRQPRRSGTAFSLTPGQKRTDIVLRLTPQSAISGRVVDMDGEPLQGVQMQLWQGTYRSGRRELAVAYDRKTSTDDRGLYRIAQVPPGQYYLSAFYPETYTSKEDVRYVRTFYPGGFDDAGAAPLPMAPAAELENMNLKLSPVQTVHIRGQVADDPSAYLRLIPETGLSFNDRQIQDRSVAPDGRFEFDGVRPGTYHVVVHAGGKSRAWVRRSVTVGASDVDGLAIRIPPPGWIAGHVGIEGETNAAPSPILIVVTAAYPNVDVYGPTSTTPAKDGTFRIADLAPDRYQVLASGSMEGLYLKSVRLGNRELPGHILDLSGSAQIEIVLSRNTASVAGTVSLADNRPASEATVVLIPEESERRGDPSAYPRVTTDDSGRFTLSHVVPGQYRAFAWESMADSDSRYLDPEFVRAVESKGVSLTLAERGRSTVELVAIPAR